MRINPIYLLVLGVGASCIAAAMHVHTVRSGENRALQTQVDLTAGLLIERLRIAVLRNDAPLAQSLLQGTLPAAPIGSAVVMGLDGAALASWRRSPAAAGSAETARPSLDRSYYPIRTGRRPIGSSC